MSIAEQDLIRVIEQEISWLVFDTGMISFFNQSAMWSYAFDQIIVIAITTNGMNVHHAALTDTNGSWRN